MRETRNFTRIGLFLLITALSAISAFAVDLPGIKVPKGGSATSQTFYIGDAGSFTVNVRVRVAPFVVVPIGGTSKYKAELFRPDGTRADEGERLAGADFVTISLSTAVTCQQIGNWKIRVTNTAAENRQDGDVQFPSFNVPKPETYTTTLSKFAVNQGTSEDRQIPSDFEPRAPGGRMTITATWDGICLPDPAGCKATITLLRNGQPYRSTNGGKSSGYAHNALFGNANPKATISVYVPASDVSGDWTLRVSASSAGTISNVAPKVTFKEGCD
jgi:hypothetical protein